METKCVTVSPDGNPAQTLVSSELFSRANFIRAGSNKVLGVSASADLRQVGVGRASKKVSRILRLPSFSSSKTALIAAVPMSSPQHRVGFLRRDPSSFFFLEAKWHVMRPCPRPCNARPTATLSCPGFALNASCLPKSCICGRPSSKNSPPSQLLLEGFQRGRGQRVVCIDLT